MTLSLMELIAFLTLLQLIFLAIVLFNYKKGKRLSNRILAGFMISNALLIAQFLLYHYGLILHSKNIVIASFSYYPLLMPFLYLYIRSLCYSDFRLRPIHILHLLPSMVCTFSTMIVDLLVHNETQAGIFSTQLEEIFHLTEWSCAAILHLQIISYLVALYVMLRTYRKNLKDIYSTIERIDLWWCNILLLGFATMWLMDFLSWILRFSSATPPFVFYWLLVLSLFINLVLTMAITYRGLTQSESFSGIQAFSKYAASRLTHSDCEEIIQKLVECMDKEKPYLTPSLSIDDLAGKINVLPKHLSQAIHVCLNQSFYDLINSRRIEEVKKLIHEDKSQNLTLIAIAYDAGFNSKSVFNEAFKKHAGMTPKEFKRLSFN